MKRTNYSHWFLASIITLILSIFTMTSLAQSGTPTEGQSLTGTWKDDNGVIYQIRQIGDDIYWAMENLPRVRNIFVGVLSGKYFTGKWIDLPGGNIVGSGTLSLQLTGPDRFIKIDQPAGDRAYGGSVWTRITNKGPDRFDPGVIVGKWYWQNSAVLELFPDGTFKAWVDGTQTNSGTWVCTDTNTRSYTLRHQVGGWIDSMVLQEDFNTMNGKNQNGSPVTGTRIR